MGKKINVERNEALWNEEMEDTGWASRVLSQLRESPQGTRVKPTIEMEEWEP